MVRGLVLRQDRVPPRRYYWDNLPRIEIPRHVATLEYTRHALQQAREEEFQEITDLPDTLDLATVNLIEVDVNPRTNNVVKYLYNYQYNDEYQISFALLPLGGNHYRVKTVWLNTTGHNERILNGYLDRSRYAIPEEAFIIDQETKELISR